MPEEIRNISKLAAFKKENNNNNNNIPHYYEFSRMLTFMSFDIGVCLEG